MSDFQNLAAVVFLISQATSTLSNAPLEVFISVLSRLTIIPERFKNYHYLAFLSKGP
jgi:hypothetical protein